MSSHADTSAQIQDLQHSSFKGHLGLVLTSIVSLLLISAYFLWSSYTESVRDAEVTSRNLVQVIESRVGADFARAEGMLSTIAHDLGSEGTAHLVSGGKRAALDQRINHFLTKFPAVSLVNVFDAQGKRVYSSDPATPEFSIDDRPYFAPLRDDPSRPLLISDPQQSRSTGNMSLALVHAVRSEVGKFQGIVSAIIRIDEYAELLKGIDLGPGGAMQLRRSDNFKLVLRQPSLDPHDFHQPMPANHPVRLRIEAGDTSGTVIHTSHLDGQTRAASFIKIAHYPFYAQVAIAKSHYLAGWYQQLMFVAIILTLLLVAVGIALRRILRSEYQARNIRRRLDEQRLLTEESGRRMALALRGGDLGLWDWDVPNGRFVFNEHWGTLLGYGAVIVELCADERAKLVHPDDWPAINAALEPHLKGETTHYECEYRLRHQTGRWVWILDRGQVVERDAAGGALRAVGTHMDITTRKTAEDALRRSHAELEQFSYGISHDMRQPLRMISSYLQLLKMDLGQKLNPTQTEHFNFAIDGAQRLDAMLHGLLEYSRVGRKGEPPVWIDSRTVLDDALLFLQPAAAEAAAVIRTEGDWPRVFASPDELLRLMQNLIGNAIKFRLAGQPPEITISGKTLADHWQLSVSDNGIGIPPGQLNRLFQMFQRLQPRGHYEGTGIGLALCRKIVEHHSGTICADSPGTGQGSRFEVVLPLAPPHRLNA